MDYFQRYLDYVGDTESPLLYHRWTSLSIIGALLGRNTWLPMGHSVIYPNMYIQLMGAPGTRKSTAIGIGRRVLKSVGYNRFAPDRLSKEQFLREMIPPEIELSEEDADLSILVTDKAGEIFVVAEEFGDFLGQGNMEFATLLTKLWDNPAEYTHPKIHGKSVVVTKPTVNMLSGNTVQGLALTIPPEGIGNGFMSRLLFVYADETGHKITFPPPPDECIGDELAKHLEELKERVKGPMDKSKAAMHLLDRIYREFMGMSDSRLKYYSTRRFTHLLKLCMIFAAASLRNIITEHDVLRANTLLHFTELKMGKALGEFGRSKYSDITNIVMDALANSVTPLTIQDLWKLVCKDLNKIAELGEMMRGLLAAEQVQIMKIGGKQGYMPLHTEIKEWDSSLLLPDFLTEKEIT